MTVAPAAARAMRGVVALLVVSVAINYVDRGNLSIAAPMLKDELGISAAQLGLLLSAFFWTYASFQLVSGWLVDRFDENWLLGAGFFFWSIATAFTGVVHGFVTLFACRLALGIGESVAYPCYSKILAANLEEHERGLPNAMIDAGTKFGPSIGTLTGGFLMAAYGWRPFFIVLGLGSLVWLPLWFAWKPKPAHTHAVDRAALPSVFEIVGQRAAWGSFVGHFCGNYFWYFMLTWLPFYLVRERHFSLDQMASVGALAYILTGLTSTLVGWISDRAIRRGRTPTFVRKTCTGAGLAFATVVVLVAATPNRTLSMVLLMIACMSYGTFASSHWAITQTLAGPRAAGKWSGVQNFVANLSGVVAPAVTGLVVDRTGQFFWAFAVSAGVVLVGAAAYLFVIPSIEPVVWRTRVVRETAGP